MTIKTATKVARKLATGDYGYGQDDRLSALADNGELGVAGLAKVGDTDCSMSIGIIYHLAGFIDRTVLGGTFYTGNLARKLASTGLFDLVDVRKLSLAQVRAKVRECDSLLGVGHVVYGLGGGKCVSFEATEKGRSTGGKKGDQTGREGRIRDIYLRGASSRRAGKSVTGWVTIIRPKSPASLLGTLLAAYGAGRSTAVAQARLTRRAPWDGPRCADLLAEWAALDQGAPVVFDATTLTVPDTGHAFIILGGTARQMQHRVQAGLPAILAHPASRVIVSGAPLREGVTEAEWMRRALVAAGVDDGRIVLEGSAGSTIGNALRCVTILRDRKLSSYTLISSASHLRRAGILFRAALAKAEVADNRRRGIAATPAVGWDDYGDQPKASLLPVDAKTRATYAGFVAALLGVTEQYKAAL